MDDWPQIKARLEEAPGICYEEESADIRAALQRESTMRDERDRYAKAWKESCDRNVVLRQRVEELEQDRESMAHMTQVQRERAEAAEAKLTRCVEALEGILDTSNPLTRERDEWRDALKICESTSAFRHEEIKRYQAEVARLEGLILDFDRASLNSDIIFAEAALRDEAKRIRGER